MARLIDDPERARRLDQMIEDGYSINEIMRTLNMDHRTIRRRHPDYHGIGKPGSPEHQAVVKMAKRFKELERKEWL